MTNDRLIHDVAWSISQELLGIVENLLREEEKRECFREFLAVVEKGLHDLETRREREKERLLRK